MRTDLDAQAMQHELDEALLDYRHASERGLWLARKRVDAAIAALQSRLAAPVVDADAVRRETVEACARIAETMAQNIPLLGKTENYTGEYGSEYDQGAGDALSECAAAIRAMLKEDK